MGATTWKNIERGVCRYLGCERSGPTGIEGPDCSCNDLPISVQVKHRENIPAWFSDMVSQTVGQAHPGKLPLLVLHALGTPIHESYSVVRLSDMRNLLCSGYLLGPWLLVQRNEREIVAIKNPAVNWF